MSIQRYKFDDTVQQMRSCMYGRFVDYHDHLAEIAAKTDFPLRGSKGKKCLAIRRGPSVLTRNAASTASEDMSSSRFSAFAPREDRTPVATSTSLICPFALAARAAFSISVSFVMSSAASLSVGNPMTEEKRPDEEAAARTADPMPPLAPNTTAMPSEGMDCMETMDQDHPPSLMPTSRHAQTTRLNRRRNVRYQCGASRMLTVQIS